MTADEGADFLLRRSKVENPSHADRTAARDLSKQLGGLPLALNQARSLHRRSAGVRERISPDPSTSARARSCGRCPEGHRITTRSQKPFHWRLRGSVNALGILSASAHLWPRIRFRRKILTGGEEPDLEFREAIAKAAKYSLISRSAAGLTIEIHRLVQDVVKAG